MALYHDPGLSINNFYKISREGKAWDTCHPRSLNMSLKFDRLCYLCTSNNYDFVLYMIVFVLYVGIGQCSEAV